MPYRTALLALPVLLLVAAPAAEAKKAFNTCTSTVGKQWIKADGKTLQTLRSGQYYAYRHPGGTWTFCDSKRPAKKAFKTFNYEFGGQANVGVELLSQPNKCVTLRLRPSGAGYPSLPSIDMRPSGARAGSSAFQIDYTAPGATVVKAQLSSTCLLAAAYRSADGTRHIQLNTVITNTARQTINLSAAATDADLKSVKLSGNKVSWTDAGVAKSQ